MLDFIPDFPRTILAFLMVLGVLVFIHELGHYLAARWRGVHVDAFAIGFGRAITSWTDRRGTEWRLAWIPLGGYVKLHGQADLGELSAEDRAKLRPGQTFHDKPVRDRAIVVVAGPVANFLLAILLFAGLFAFHGQPVGQTAIGAVAPGSAAERAGLLAGERVELPVELGHLVLDAPLHRLLRLGLRGAHELALRHHCRDQRLRHGRRFGFTRLLL
jgi:regulator of sigma E protease